MNRILYIEPTDFTAESYGSGGASISASALRTMGNKFMYVGITSDNQSHIGKWIKIKRYNNDVWFFPVCGIKKMQTVKQGLKNLYFAFRVLKYMKKIEMKNNIKLVFTRTTTIMWLFALFQYRKKIVFYAPGLRYTDFPNRHPLFGKLLLPIFKIIHASALNKIALIFAAASRDEIERYERELRWYGFKGKFIQLPTAVDTNIFFPRDKALMRKKYNLPQDKPIFIFVGRLAKVKGVDFLIDSILIYKKKWGNCLFLILGDGEERLNLEKYVKRLQLHYSVSFLGNCPPQCVAELIGAADVCLVGSYYEGFSVAMIEEIASGRPIVTTPVSGAYEIIKEGENGFIVGVRDPTIFASKMKDALTLKNVAEINSALVKKQYDEKLLWDKVIHMIGLISEIMHQNMSEII